MPKGLVHFRVSELQAKQDVDAHVKNKDACEVWEESFTADTSDANQVVLEGSMRSIYMRVLNAEQGEYQVTHMRFVREGGLKYEHVALILGQQGKLKLTGVKAGAKIKLYMVCCVAGEYDVDIFFSPDKAAVDAVASSSAVGRWWHRVMHAGARSRSRRRSGRRSRSHPSPASPRRRRRRSASRRRPSRSA